MHDFQNDLLLPDVLRRRTISTGRSVSLTRGARRDLARNLLLNVLAYDNDLFNSQSNEAVATARTSDGKVSWIVCGEFLFGKLYSDIQDLPWKKLLWKHFRREYGMPFIFLFSCKQSQDE